MKLTVNRTVQILIFSAFLLFYHCIYAKKPLAPEQLPGVTVVNSEEVVSLVLANPDLVIIDARREEEHNKGFIENSISLLDTKMTEQNLAELAGDKNTAIIFYCNGVRCLRSYTASKKAQQWGYKNIYWFRGGWKEWVRKGMPISY